MTPSSRWRLALAAANIVLASNIEAARLSATVTDAKGGAIPESVVFATTSDGKRASTPAKAASMDQVNKEFVPFVLPVQLGAEVRFPNKDNIRHHVYSFSPAKAFELKLYSGVPSKPVMFDKPGAVALGCNIHDTMVGYIYVVDTPWFAKTGKDGEAKIEGLPAGDYDLQLVHYGQAVAQAAAAIRLRSDETLAQAFAVALKPPVPRPQAK